MIPSLEIKERRMLMRKRADRMNLKNAKPIPDSPIKGIVKARTCEHCGHHEIGILTKSGEYLPLKPGMRVTVFQGEEAKG